MLQLRNTPLSSNRIIVSTQERKLKYTKFCNFTQVNSGVNSFNTTVRFYVKKNLFTASLSLYGIRYS